MTSPRDANAAPPPVPATAMTTPPRASADMQAVLDALASLQPQPLTAITPGDGAHPALLRRRLCQGRDAARHDAQDRTR